MRLSTFLGAPVRLTRDLPIAAKLAVVSVCALALLSIVSWFAFDRLVAVGALQDGVAVEAATARQIQQSLLATLELRVVSRELQYQQTVAAVNAAAARAVKQHVAARESLSRAQTAVTDAAEKALVGKALDALDGIADAVKHEAELRTAMLTARQKRLFQARAPFDSSLQLLIDEVGRGGAVLSGVDAVTNGAGTSAATVDLHDPRLQAVTDYRVAMVKMQGAALTYMATSSGSAANELRDAIADANRHMTELKSHDLPGALKTDVDTVNMLGTSMAQVAVELIDQTKQLDAIAQTQVETASQAMQQAIEQVAQSINARVRSVSEKASQARSAAKHDMIMLIGAIAGLMLLFGIATSYAIAAPLRSLARIVQAIAGGDTAVRVRFTEWRDETGRMAAAVETLRGVMQQTFVQSQMIEQIPVGVMTAEATGNFRITYVNPETVRMMETIKDHLPVGPDQLPGQGVEIFRGDGGQQNALAVDPANLPHRTRLAIGSETFEVNVSAILDRHGDHAGLMLTWHCLTGQARLVERFERTVGTIAATVGASAIRMQDTAAAMSDAADDARQRTSAVADASHDASTNVGAVAASTEELAASVAEIDRQVTESSRIAGQAVIEAETTDRYVGGLSEAAGRISNVVKLISNIAAQTNLLALNATIEAARAGDAGKGFAVVATEVKALATQTAHATEEIAAQISTMQGATDQVVSALRSIADTIQCMNQITTTIAGAVEEQGAATQEIARAVQQAAAGTSEVNSNIAVVAEAVDRNGTQAGAVLRAATQLTEQSDALKREVQDFLGAVQQAA
jgi:methyl-accepting chemotaxis protein